MTFAYQLQHIQVHAGSQCILDLPKLDIPAGKLIALLGDNGAGKSTLLNLLALTTQPSQGEFTLAAQPFTPTTSKQMQRQLGYVAQQPYLFHGSVENNIQLALKLQGSPREHNAALVQSALEQVGLTQLANQSAASLSGGERKRAAIARAIAHQPKILLLDEPFSHLDTTSRKQLTQIIQHYASQPEHTVIFSTHDHLQALSLNDDVIYLNQGKLAPAPRLNLFHGSQQQHVFDTGKLKIEIPQGPQKTNYIAIDPKQIVISKQALHSSMRNHFLGRLILIAEENNVIHLTVDCGENFHVLISPQSLESLDLSVGKELWLSFKSNAVQCF